MQYRLGKKSSGYSLIELLVVLAVIALILISSLPNIFGRSDRLSLDNGAQRIRQYLLDARTRSLAPTKNDDLGSGQIFQVVFGAFTPPANSFIATGSENTNLISLERGLAKCDSGDLQGGFISVKNFKLQRGIYISKFYPSNQGTNDLNAVVRFSVGKIGFDCGAQNDPSISSTRLNSGAWTGVYSGSSSDKAVARYLTIELNSRSSSAKRFIALDRETSEVTISDFDPQSYYQAITDNKAPRWKGAGTELPNNLTMGLTCGQDQSTVTLSYLRAEDRTVDDNVVDPSLAVFYDLSWNVNGEKSGPNLIFRPLATKFYQDVGVGNDTIVYRFTTTDILVANQPSKVTVKIRAEDDATTANKQAIQDQSNIPTSLDLTNVNKERWKDFSPTCGTVAGENPTICDSTADNVVCLIGETPPTGQEEPGPGSQACPVTYEFDRHLASTNNVGSSYKQRLYYFTELSGAQLALVEGNPDCPIEEPE